MNILYQSYLLRIWISNSKGDRSWHATLENPHTRVITTYQNLEGLFRFLRETSDQSECNNVPESDTKEGNEK